MADEAVLLGPAEVTESYLKADKILQIAKDTGAQAIHPDTGFYLKTPLLPKNARKMVLHL